MDALFHLNRIRNIASDLPGAEEYICFGTPAFRVKKKLLMRMREDGETLVVHSDDRDIWTDARPDVFFITPHYFNYPSVLVKLPLIDDPLLQQVIIQGWMEISPKRVVAHWITRQADNP